MQNKSAHNTQKNGPAPQRKPVQIEAELGIPSGPENSHNPHTVHRLKQNKNRHHKHHKSQIRSGLVRQIQKGSGHRGYNENQPSPGCPQPHCQLSESGGVEPCQILPALPDCLSAHHSRGCGHTHTHHHGQLTAHLHHGMGRHCRASQMSHNGCDRRHTCTPGQLIKHHRHRILQEIFV